MPDITERIVIPEVPRVLDGQELYVYIPERQVNSYTKVEIDDLLATKFDKSNVARMIGDSADKVMSQKAVTEELNTKLDKGLIPSEYLPSYVDDVLEYDNKSSFPSTGETGKIYVDKSTNLTYRWSGSTYIQVGGGDLNLENGEGLYSLAQIRVSTEGEPRKCKAYQKTTVALGGNSLGGGKFNMPAAILGAYIIQFLTTTLYKFNVSSDAIPAYKAVVVIVLVIISAPAVQEKVNAFNNKRKAAKEAA